MTPPDTDSPAHRFLSIMFAQWGTDGWSRSWTRFNAATTSAMRLAIECGLLFGPGDYARFSKRNTGTPDDMYAVAVLAGNKSAAASIDAALGRKPLVVGKHFRGRWMPKRLAIRNRVHIGAVFWLNDEWWHVTSIGDGGDSATACVFEFDDATRREKLVRRRTFTRDDFKPKGPSTDRIAP